MANKPVAPVEPQTVGNARHALREYLGTAAKGEDDMIDALIAAAVKQGRDDAFAQAQREAGRRADAKPVALAAPLMELHDWCANQRKETP